MRPVDLVNLVPLMARTVGRRDVAVGLIDGPVATSHPDLVADHIHDCQGKAAERCTSPDSFACEHGTFVAGILVARRGSPAPAICPGCTLLLRTIFPESKGPNGRGPSATPEELARAIVETIDAGARVLNLSAALNEPSQRGDLALKDALDYSARRGILVVAAAGNEGTVGSSTLTRHPSVIPVVGCRLSGAPMGESNLGHSIGRHGLSAPGENVTSLDSHGSSRIMNGTSVAAAFVTGAIALLWSEFPDARASDVRFAVTQGDARRPTTIVPRLLDASAAYDVIARMRTAPVSRPLAGTAAGHAKEESL